MMMKPGVPNYVDGGSTRSCSDAPKAIKSKNIVEFKANFCYYNSWCREGFEFIFMNVHKEASDGPFILQCRGYKFEVDECFLAKVQEVIDRNKLINCNGVFESVCGLPREAQPYSLTAVYDSGEKLSFNASFNPTASWCAELRRLLCDELVRHGIEDMLPPKEDRKLVRFDLEINVWPRKTLYATITLDEEKPRANFSKEIWNYETNEPEIDEVYDTPDGFYEHIAELIEQTKLRDYCNGRIDFPSTRMGAEPIDRNHTPFIKYCAEGESGKQFNTFIYGDDIPDGLRIAAGIIQDYIEGALSKLKPVLVFSDPEEDEEDKSTKDAAKTEDKKDTVKTVDAQNTWQCPRCGTSTFHPFCPECGTERNA